MMEGKWRHLEPSDVPRLAHPQALDMSPIHDALNPDGDDQARRYKVGRVGF
jgi:hypothetical protein